MTTLETILTKKGPLLSSDLARMLSQERGMKFNTASQNVSRSTEIKQLKGFFKSNQSLCYLPNQTKDNELLDVFTNAMFEHGRKYWYTINALKMHDGVISKKYLECYTNYPVIPLKKHIPFDEVMRKFTSEGILIYNDDEYLFSPRFSSIIPNTLMHRTIELLKDTILNDFHSLARNIGLISYETGEQFSEFGKFRWSFKGVCPVIGLKNGEKFGFLLADILIGKPFYKDDILFFIEKLNHVLSFKNASKIIPILIVDDIALDGLQFIKQKGIVIGFIRELFGQKYSETLKEVLAVLNNAGASLKSNPEKYLELIAELKKYNEGLANNIRGTLFEFVIGHIHSQYCQSIDIGREIISDSKRHEMDVLAIYPDKVVISECKAKKQTINAELIQGWLKIKIPAFRSWILKQETLKEKKVEFEFWSTSPYDDDAMDLLDEAEKSITKYKVSYYGAKELRQKAIQMKNKKLKEALDNYFIKPSV